MLHAVQSNRLRRFGRLHEFLLELFLLKRALPESFFLPKSGRRQQRFAGVFNRRHGFYTYGAAAARPWTLMITIRSLQRFAKT